MFEGHEGIEEKRGGVSQPDVILAVLSVWRARRAQETGSNQGHTYNTLTTW